MTTFGVGISRHNQRNMQQEMHATTLTTQDFKLPRNHTKQAV